MTHASDCALHNAPATAPAACSCGVSLPFHLWCYRITDDEFGWQLHSRETLVAEVASGSLVRCYNTFAKQVRSSLLIVRAFTCGLVEPERKAIYKGWEDAWTANQTVLEAAHLSDIVQRVDGWPLSREERLALAREPDEEECAAAVALWAPWWASLPHPPDQL